MKSVKNALLILFSISFISACQPKKATQTDNDFELVWSDEFDYSGLPDSTKWTYDTEGNSAGWGNNEDQFYTTARIENANVENGNLAITAIREDIEGKKFSSARLISKADWKYARVEVRAKVPGGRGTWAAIWMMPGGWSFNDGNWPDVGEIDIMEHVGHESNTIHASAHSKDYQWQIGTQKTGVMNVPEATEKFHKYILDWTEDVMKVYVDDSCYFTYQNEKLGETKWPYDKPYYLILNVAVGGAWGSIKGIDESAFPQTMEIDYVRIYKRKN